MTAGGDDDDAAERGGTGADPTALARTYYRALDAGDYDLLASLLAPSFVHDRPDVTLEGSDRFVRFMREERPQTDTTHPIDGIYVPAVTGADGEGGGRNGAEGVTEVVVRGRLLAADGTRITAFVDVFEVSDGALGHLRTFSR